jgi:hypothetical protein
VLCQPALVVTFIEPVRAGELAGCPLASRKSAVLTDVEDVLMRQ